MTTRGTKPSRETIRRRDQRHLGYLDGIGGARLAPVLGGPDQYYLRGYRAGVAAKHQVEATADRCRTHVGDFEVSKPCGRIAKADWLDADFSGEWIPVCGTHGHVAERRALTVKWRE